MEYIGLLRRAEQAALKAAEWAIVEFDVMVDHCIRQFSNTEEEKKL